MPSIPARHIAVGALLLVTAFFANASGAHAQTQQLWGSSLANGLSSVTLRQINPATGAAAPAFNITGGSGSGVSDLAGDPLWQGLSLWGVRSAFSTGYIAAWNPVAQTFISEVALNSPTIIRTLAIDPADGSFYGTTTTDLYSIDPHTGQTTLIGPTSGFNLTSAIEFGPTGQLYGVGSNKLYTINKTSGSASLVASLSISNVESLALRPDGAMLAIGAAGLYHLYELNLATGAATDLGFSMERVSGLAFTGLRADFDGNGQVDEDDFDRWKSNFGHPGATYAQGDANGDGTVDGADLLVWQRQLGMTINLFPAPSVPEPSAALLITAGLLALSAIAPWTRRIPPCAMLSSA